MPELQQENLRARLVKVRKDLRLTQKELAEKLEYKQSHISNIENGKDNIGKSILFAYTNALGVNKEWLETGVGEMFFNDVTKNSGKASPDQSVSFGVIKENGNEFLDIGHNQYMMFVPLVEEYAYAGFLSGFADQEYIKELPRHPILVNQFHRGKYIAIRCVGDSMDNGQRGSIAEGDVVTGRNIDKNLWSSRFHIHKYKNYIIVHNEGILIKQIIAHDVENGIITCHSLNTNKVKYPDFEISLNEVKMIFNVVNISMPG